MTTKYDRFSIYLHGISFNPKYVTFLSDMKMTPAKVKARLIEDEGFPTNITVIKSPRG